MQNRPHPPTPSPKLERRGASFKGPLLALGEGFRERAGIHAGGLLDSTDGHPMKKLVRQTFLKLALLGLGLAPLGTIVSSQAQLMQPGTFRATKDCPATRAINGANPGNIRLNVGQSYSVIGFNSNARRYILLNIPNATPNQRWVSATCGNFKATEPGTPSTPDDGDNPPQTPPTTTGVLPFFDNVNNPVSVAYAPNGNRADISPPAPTLTPFDRAVLKTCGPLGTKLTANNVRSLLSSYPDVVQKAKRVTGGELLSGRRTDAEFLDDLVAAWSDREGFEHIFCGELESSQKIGGLHFVGRYLQIQQAGGGRLANNARKEEVIPGVVYTLGVVIKTGNRTFTDDLKGYPYPVDASEMFLEATRLYKAQGNAQGACIATVKDNSGASYSAVFVKDRGAIVTFYPDATPKGKACRG
jgi:hypothetical protein